MTSIAVAGRMIYLHLTTRWFSEIQPWYLLCQLKQNHTKSGCAQSGDAACGSARTLSLALGSLLLFAFPGSFQQLAAAFCKISQMARKCMDLYVMNICIYIYIYHLGVPVCTPMGKNLANPNSRRLLLFFGGKESSLLKPFCSLSTKPMLLNRQRAAFLILSLARSQCFCDVH